MGRMWLPAQDSWRLDERHFGALPGLDKVETAGKFGEFPLTECLNDVVVRLISLWR